MGFLKKITRPISRALDKIIPNEIKPALPFLAAAAPFMAPGLMSLGGNTMLSRALMSGGLNIGAQLAQEGSEGEFSGLSALMAAGTGALSAPGTRGTGVGPAGQYGTTGGTPSAGEFFRDKAMGMDPGLTKSGLGALETSSNYLSGVSDTLQNNLFSMEGLKAAAIPIGQGTTDLAVAENRRAMRDYEKELADYEAGLGDSSDTGNRALAIRQSMEAYGFPEQEILDAIEAAGYRAGGRVGYAFGDLVRGSGVFKPVPNSSGGPMPSSGMGGMLSNLINSNPQIFSNITNQENNSVSNMSRDFIDLNQNGIDDRQEKAYGGRVGFDNGGTTPVYLKDSILKDKDFLKTLSSADKLENFMTEFLEEKKLPSKRKYNKVMDTFDSIESEEGTISKLENKYADKYDYDTLDPFDRGPMEVLIMEKMLEDREKSVGELDLKTYEMIKELGLEDKFIELEKERDRKKNKKAIGGRVGLKDGGDPDFGGIPAAVKAVEEKPKEFLVDKLKVTVQPGQSEQMAIMNAMMNDIDEVMPEDRKMEFYKLYLPQLRASGEISENEYEGLMGELFGEGKANGGRIGLQEGGVLAQILPQASQITAISQRPSLGSFQPLQQAQSVFPRLNELEQGVNIAENKLTSIRDRLGNERGTLASMAFQRPLGLQPAFQPLGSFQPSLNMLSLNRGSGISALQSGPEAQGMKDGGLMNLGGREMDMRTGGFIPIGKKERADDVPARLSKNEFVMTADAVRAAGGGSVNEGARRMYNLMNNLEAKV